MHKVISIGSGRSDKKPTEIESQREMVKNVRQAHTFRTRYFILTKVAHDPVDVKDHDTDSDEDDRRNLPHHAH